MKRKGALKGARHSKRKGALKGARPSKRKGVFLVANLCIFLVTRGDQKLCAFLVERGDALVAALRASTSPRSRTLPMQAGFFCALLSESTSL